jgi:hypothetical protein
VNEPESGSRVRPGRGLAAPAGALAALLAVVAIASAARLGDSGAGGARLSLPEGFFAWFYALFLILGAIAFPFFVYISTRTSPYDKSGRRRAWLAPLWVAGIFGGLVLARWLFADEFEHVFDQLGIGDAGAPNLPSAPEGGAPPAPEPAPLATFLGLAIAGVGGFLVWRTVRRRGRTLAGRVTDDLSNFVEETLDDLRDEPDVRRAIVRAYARMERVLERSGVPREEAEAPLEYVARVLLELDVRPGPVHALTELFERARFSTHALGPDAKAEAIAALEALRDDLQAAEGTPQPEPA